MALANSESATHGCQIVCDIVMLEEGLEKTVREWLDYGKYRGMGAWRNSGKGRFTWEEVK